MTMRLAVASIMDLTIVPRMNLRDIVDAIARKADDFFAGASSRAEARAGVYELINADYFPLSPADRTTVAEGVMAILDQEGVFEEPAGGGASDADDGTTEDE